MAEVRLKKRPSERDEAEAGPARWPEEPGPALDDEPETPDREFRRPARRARVRRSLGAALARRSLRLLRSAWPALLALLVLLLAYRYVTTSPAFALSGSDAIEVSGARHLAAARVDRVFAADFGRNIFFVPLQARADALLQIPWVRRASVLRIWPDRLRVEIEERVPVAFARVGSRLDLVDEDGVLLPPPPRAHYDFPVLAGLAGTPSATASNEGDAGAQRRAQVRRYLDLRQALADGGVSAAAISEVRLNDPDDLVAVVAVAPGAALLLHLGDGAYLARYKLFLAHVEDWRRSYPRLQSVDLRYDGQAILDSAPAPAVKPAAAARRRVATRRR